MKIAEKRAHKKIKENKRGKKNAGDDEKRNCL